MIPRAKGILITYLDSFEGQFHFHLKRSAPQDLVMEMTNVVTIEEDLNNANIEPFSYPRAKIEKNPKEGIPSKDPIIALGQKFEHLTMQLTQSQNTMMNEITNMKRQNAPRGPTFSPPRRDNNWRP
jgi:hypothetical protein